LLYKIDSKDDDYVIFSDAMTFTKETASFSYMITTPKEATDCFSLLTLDPSDDSRAVFSLTYEGGTANYAFSSDLHGRLFVKSMMFPGGGKTLKLTVKMTHPGG
jgi:hypothetical protein